MLEKAKEKRRMGQEKISMECNPVTFSTELSPHFAANELFSVNHIGLSKLHTLPAPSLGDPQRSDKLVLSLGW